MASIDVTGLGTANIVDQLMQLEAIPRTRLKIQQANHESVINVLRGLNTRVATLGSAAENLATPAKWAVLKATSTDPKVSVTVADGAVPGRLSVTTEQVAKAHQLGFAQAGALTDVVTDASKKVRLDLLDGTVHDLDTGDGSLKSVIAAINAADAGVTATAIRTGPDAYRLLVSSNTTGAASDFTLSNTDGTDLLGGATVVAGADARVSLGAGITATSATNTFTDLLPGVSVTLAQDTAVGSTATVSLQRDGNSVKSTVKNFVDQVNGLLEFIASETGGVGAKAGKLSGDSRVRGLRDNILDTLQAPDGRSLSSLGIQLTKDGRLSLDEAKLATAIADDPAGVQAQMIGTTAAPGWATRVSKLATAASHPDTGIVSQAIKGRESLVTTLGENITAWDMRLQMRKATLTRQYTGMETALNRLNNQGTWLAGQLASLNKS